MLSELCIRRPVMTILLMVSFLAAGMFGYGQLPVAAVPRVDFPTIQVSAQLPGASPETMASSVALVLEKQFSTIAGVSSMTSTSTYGNTSIVLQFDLNRNIDGAALDVQSQISAAMRRLPVDMVTPPSFRKVNPADFAIMFIAISSDTARLSDIDRFANSSILPRISTLPGIAQVMVWGSQKFAVRVRADLDQLAARGLTLADLQNALTAANSNRPVGTVNEGGRNAILDATGPINRSADYRDVIVAWQNGAPVRVSDVASPIDGVENDRAASWLDGKRAIVLGVQRQPDANTVDVVDRVRAMLPQIQREAPAAYNIQVMMDRSKTIRESIEDVQFTLALAAVLVIVVIWFFLKDWRATLIPAAALPISIIGTFAVMYVLGYSIDNISLLALTLAVGFVVDDAIVMLENIMRYIEEGMDPFQAALVGSREVGFTIISMTISLVAVFIPVLFMGGVVGRMFAQFGVVISTAILISGVVSLTLTPMLCSRVLKPIDHNKKPLFLLRWFEAFFSAVTRGYGWSVKKVVNMPVVMIGITIATFVVTFMLFRDIPKGFFPQEDNGIVRAATIGPDDVSFAAMVERTQQLAAVVRRDPDVVSVMANVGSGGGATTQNSGSLFITLRDKPARKDNAVQVIDRLRRAANEVPGIQAFFSPIQSITVGTVQSRSQYQYMLQSPDLDALRQYAPILEAKMRTLPGILDVNSDLQMRARSTIVDVDRDAASRLGVTADQVRNTLYSAFGTRQVSTIYASEDTYQVILEADPKYYDTSLMLRRLTVRSSTGAVVPLDAVARLREQPTALSVGHLAQLPAVTISFNLPQGVALSQAVERIEVAAREIGLPATIASSFQGTAQVFQQAVANQGLLLFAAVLVIYIILGILYESFIHPFTILSGLPSAGIGALLTLQLFHFDLSVIAMIGLVMLIGIVKKNAIMMVDFAIERRQKGVPAKEAIVEAAVLRFRPIMMTTLCAILGAVPIAIGHGAGAELRQPLGIAVVGGLILSQLLTLYITPVVYLMFEGLSNWIGRRGSQPAGEAVPAPAGAPHGQPAE
ncbi:MAG: efflux RND transporter permease subunit [Phreatobacter sp.]|uniref:efflux RND transporter permease subunit n=1 Tax=Phreatobacter sp. TaxID=1966341 RepID=UPI001A5ABEE1|nr:efflux RND transporter permease subunit [Phreatobacter sp.]MBL8567574.1 efflux RND transporter permease subunit [Phreatobacter sp.]